MRPALGCLFIIRIYSVNSYMVTKNLKSLLTGIYAVAILTVSIACNSHGGITYYNIVWLWFGEFFVSWEDSMKVIKNINNNYALALDNEGNQLIISGRGIGFGPVPREIKDLTVINRSFYDVDDAYVNMINDIAEENIEISTAVIDKARSLIESPISSNVIFTLADHIQFAVDRFKKGMSLNLPIMYDVQNLYEEEMKAGEYALELIQKRLKIRLPREEAAGVALHLINAEMQDKQKTDLKNAVIEEITTIIEAEYGIRINRENFNYSRFVSHLQYLLKRGKTGELVQSANRKLFDQIKEEHPSAFVCGQKISGCLKKHIQMELTDEEILYLMLHINRLCTREDCNQ